MSSRLSRLESVLKDSGVAAMLEAAIPTAGPPRQLRAHAVLVGILLSISTAKVAHLASSYRALCDLPVPDQIRLGVARHSRNGLKIATYRQFEHSFSQVMAPIDPSPVPSFRGVRQTERAEYLAERRKGIESACKQAMLFDLTDALLEASIPENHRSRRCLAVDWTDHESWARPKDKASCEPSADPDAAWGHAKRNAPGAKDGLFFGYYAQVAVMAPEEGSKGDPEFICRVVLKSASVEPAERDGRPVRAHGQQRRRAERRAGGLRLLVQDRLQLPVEKDRGPSGDGPAPLRPRTEGHLRRSRLCQWESLLPFGARASLVTRPPRVGCLSSGRRGP